MAASGRLMRIIKGTTAVAGARTDNLSIANEPVDITDKDDGGWRTLHTVAGAMTISADVEGVLKDDGIAWTLRTSAADNSWYSVCWSPELGLFCAVAYSGTGNRVMTSPDGITWTVRTSAADNSWFSVCWSPELGLFCAVSGTGTGNRVMTSPDGITWTLRTSAADLDWRSVCWSPDLGLFCATAATGTGNRVMTSPDGITWTVRTSAADNSWYSVCWSPELGLFCAVAATGTGNRVMTSPDGITWTLRASAADSGWRSVCWSPELGLFCAVASSGVVGSRVMTSPDGVNWTIRTSAADNQWLSVCWSPELGLFAAVSFTGTGNRVMTSRGTILAVAAAGTALLGDYTIAIENIGRFNGDWFLSAFTAGAAQADAVTFTANIESSGPIAALLPTVLPAVTGTAQSGQTLTTTNGTWLGSPSFARQWQESANGLAWSNISGATGLTIVLAPGQVGNLVRCKVTATASYGDVVVWSNSVGPVIAA